jgi:hypothetical protein
MTTRSTVTTPFLHPLHPTFSYRRLLRAVNSLLRELSRVSAPSGASPPSSVPPPSTPLQVESKSSPGATTLPRSSSKRRRDRRSRLSSTQVPNTPPSSRKMEPPTKSQLRLDSPSPQRLTHVRVRFHPLVLECEYSPTDSPSCVRVPPNERPRMFCGSCKSSMEPVIKHRATLRVFSSSRQRWRHVPCPPQVLSTVQGFTSSPPPPSKGQVPLTPVYLRYWSESRNGWRTVSVPTFVLPPGYFRLKQEPTSAPRRSTVNSVKQSKSASGPQSNSHLPQSSFDRVSKWIDDL